MSDCHPAIGRENEGFILGQAVFGGLAICSVIIAVLNKTSEDGMLTFYVMLALLAWLIGLWLLIA